jgi:hypothetical protein
MPLKSLLVLALSAALGTLAAAQTDVVKQLGSNTTEAQETIFSSFSGGTVYPTGTKSVFKTATDEGKAAMVRGVVAFARSYSTSADFAKRYGMYRENQKPSPPETPKTGAQMRIEQKKSMQEAINNLEQLAVKMPQMKKDVDKSIAEMKDNMARLDTDTAANAQMDKAMAEGAAFQATDYKERLAKWEKTYPVEPTPMIAGRLKEFLAMAATVDFTATLVPSKYNPKTMVFANQAFESKDSQWKMLYRAGKPAVDAARAAAQEWLKAIGG